MLHFILFHFVIILLSGVAKAAEKDHKHCAGPNPCQREAAVCTGREPGAEGQAERGGVTCGSGEFSRQET